MGIKDKLTTDGSVLARKNGKTPAFSDLAKSTLHNAYSINGKPYLKGYPTPSSLDLNGVTPKKYYDIINLKTDK